MRLRAAAFILASLLATPAYAGFAWSRAGISASAWDDSILAVCVGSSTKATRVNRAATSKTAAFEKIVWSGGTPTVTQADLPTVAATFGNPRWVMCDDTNTYSSGGGTSDAWVYKSAISTISWTAVYDFSLGGAKEMLYAFGFSPPGADVWLAADVTHDGANDRMNTGTVTATPTYSGSSIYQTLGDNFATTDGFGIKVSASYSLIGVAGNGKFWIQGWQGTTSSSLFTSGTCPGPSSGIKVRPPLSDGTVGVGIAFNGTNTYFCGANSAGTLLITVTGSSADYRPGANWANGLAVWKTDGTAYFLSQSGLIRAHLYDVPAAVLNGSTVTQVVSGIDADGDADAANNLVGILADGSIITSTGTGVTSSTTVYVPVRHPPSLSGGSL